MLQILKNATNLSNFNTIWLDELLHSSLNQLWQVAINFIHADIIQLVEAATADTHEKITLQNIPKPRIDQFQSYNSLCISVKSLEFTRLVCCKWFLLGPGITRITSNKVSQLNNNQKQY